jgi:hypothetical protein
MSVLQTQPVTPTSAEVGLVAQEDERGQAMVLNSLGGVLQRLGRFEEAAEALQRSHELLAQLPQFRVRKTFFRGSTREG